MTHHGRSPGIVLTWVRATAAAYAALLVLCFFAVCVAVFTCAAGTTTLPAVCYVFVII
jgi:hypothetical protein